MTGKRKKEYWIVYSRVKKKYPNLSPKRKHIITSYALRK